MANCWIRPNENRINKILTEKVTQNTEWCIGCEKGKFHCLNQTCIQSDQNRQYTKKH